MDNSSGDMVTFMFQLGLVRDSATGKNFIEFKIHFKLKSTVLRRKQMSYHISYKC